MKRLRYKRIGILLAAILTLQSAALKVSGTYAYFRDTKELNATLTAGHWVIPPPAADGVVLNEILPHPTHNQPIEWVELYNNGSEPVDLSGWKISERSGGKGSEHEYEIHKSIGSPSKVWSLTGETIIGPHSWLVLVFAGNKLNNHGDTVSLYDAEGKLVDRHEFGEIEAEKSIARIPDGTGEWVDPLPTPNAANVLEQKAAVENTSPPTVEAIEVQAPEPTENPVVEAVENAVENIEEAEVTVLAEPTEATQEPVPPAPAETSSVEAPPG